MARRRSGMAGHIAKHKKVKAHKKTGRKGHRRHKKA